MRYSYSSLSTLQQCERKFAFSYVEGFESNRAASPAQLRGTAWHALVASHLISLGVERGTLLIRPEKIHVVDDLELDLKYSEGAFSNVVEVKLPGPGGEVVLLGPTAVCEAVGWWWEHQEGERKEELLAAFGAPLADRLDDLWARYQERWGRLLTAYEPLLVEQRWVRKAPNGRELMGYVDAVVRDPDLDMVVVVDSKSHESWPSEPDHVIDLMDSQLHLQAWGIAPLLAEHGAAKPQAVEFDRVRFKKPATPTLTQAGGLSKSVTDYDAYTYRAWCATGPRPEPTAAALKKGLTAETMPLYELDPEHLAALEANRDSWFRRSRRPLSMFTVTAHVRAAQSQAARAAEVDPKTAPISPSKSCGFCPYSSLCRATIMGGTPDPLVLSDWGLRVKKRFGRD
jgi:hypothetical protein